MIHTTPDARPHGLAPPSATPLPDRRPIAGTRMGKYEVLCRLATGGMAEIYLARQLGVLGFEKHVVVKRILPPFSSDPKFVQMFLDEARLAAQLQHQNIGQVYDIGQHDDTYFYAMEYLHGADVRAIARAASAGGERVPLPHALKIVHGVAAALHYAHERTDADDRPLDIVHRDVSPSNIIVTYAGGVKLVDFGIARATTRTIETHTGSLRGKLAYMSPEQCRAQSLDARADIFSLGIVMYELTTGQRLFRRGAESDYVVMNRIVYGEVPPPSAAMPGYPPALEAITLRALATDRNQRYQSARELLDDLENLSRREQRVMSSAGLATFLRGLISEQPEPWREGFDPVQRDDTLNEVAGSPPPREHTADVTTARLLLPERLLMTVDDSATLDERTTARPRPRLRPAQRAVKRPGRLPIEWAVFLFSCSAVLVAMLIGGWGSPREAATERTPPAWLGSLPRVGTPVVLSMPVPEPTVEALDPASEKTVARRRKTPRTRKSKRKTKTKAKAKAKAKRKPPPPEPPEEPKWDPDSPLLPSQSR
jgi:serine/threonine protein kinase